MTSSRVNLHITNYEKVEIEGKVILVPYPTKIPEFRLIDREEILNRCLAAWFSLDGLGPLNFRLYGPPGVGKNALVYRLAQILNKDLYIINGHQELGPEDIACSATMTSGQAIEYVASSLFAAVWRGGILFFDEIGKAPTAALDPLASLLDDRRTLTSVLAGIHLRAHPEFLFCAALNQDEEEGLGLPGFLDERTRPAIQVNYPSPRTMERILKANLPKAPEVWFKILMEHFVANLSPRRAIKLLRYSYGFALLEGNQSPAPREVRKYLEKAYAEVATEERGGEVS